MKILLRTHKSILDNMRHDLHRSHLHAAERVGFLSARIDDLDHGDKLMLLTDYYGVKDEHYICDNEVGARISGGAIREAMQRILDTSDGAFHVHYHADGWPIGFSPEDARGYAGLIPSLQRVGPNQAHGAIVLNSTSVLAAIWLPRSGDPVLTNRLSVVGFPFKFFGGTTNEKQ